MTNHRVGGTQIETGVDGGAPAGAPPGPPVQWEELGSNHQVRSGSNEMAARLLQLELELQGGFSVLGQIRTTKTWRKRCNLELQHNILLLQIL